MELRLNVAKMGGRGSGIQWSSSAEIVVLGMMLNSVVVSLPLGCPREQGSKSVYPTKSKRLELMEC